MANGGQEGNGFVTQFPCVICRKKPALPRTRFCEEHYRQYQLRQQNGVNTEDLSASWWDSLANWRERPGVLDERPERGLFKFGWRFEGWLLFYRKYPTRERDWLAVQGQPGQIRRFVETALFDVQDELLGLRPAPYQHDLKKRWGDPASQKPAMPEYHDALGRIQLDKQFATAAFPIYGVAGNPLSLALSSLHMTSGSRGLESVTLAFSSRSSINLSATFQLRSFDFYSLRRYPWPPREEIDETESFEQQVTIAGAELTGKIFWWVSEERCEFTLRGEKTLLMGAGSGFLRAELIEVFEQVVVINDRPELMAQYQTELATGYYSER